MDDKGKRQELTETYIRESCEWDDEICRRYAGWHDELYRVINEQVLYKT